QPRSAQRLCRKAVAAAPSCRPLRNLYGFSTIVGRNAGLYPAKDRLLSVNYPLESEPYVAAIHHLGGRGGLGGCREFRRRRRHTPHLPVALRRPRSRRRDGGP